MPVTGMRWSDPPRASCVTGIGKSTFRPFVGLSVLWPGRHLAWVCGPFLARTALCGSRWNPFRQHRPHSPLFVRPVGARAGGPRAIADRVGDGFAVAAAGGRGKQGHLVDALAPRGDEGRGTLRKAPGSREQAVIRGSPNGATHPSDGVSAAESIGGGGEPGELKHLSTRRKGHQQQSSGLRAGGRDSVSSGERTRTRPVASR